MAVRIGFIGAGGNANWHMDMLRDVPDAKVVAVTDLAFDKAKTAAEKHGAKPYASHKIMLEEEKLDCCYISVPPYQHGEPEIDVIHKGLPFFVEKPLATTWDLATDIADRIEKRGIGTCVGYQIRYLDIMDRAKEMLDGAFVNMVQGHYVCGAIGGWYTRLALSGGQITEQATHMLDLMRFLLGDVEWVCATKRQGAVVTADKLEASALGKGSVSSQTAGLQLHEYNIWDATTLLMQFESGIPGVFVCSCQVNYMFEVLLDVFTTDFRLKIDYEKMSIIRKSGGETTTEVIRADTSPKIDATFVNAVKTGDFSKVRSNYADAMKSLAVSLAAVESAETGEIVCTAD
ncbi:MAG TPA: Gfo/Idh/MocA family oxidoreductase [Candidatus Hydrogenedentes bacterium]|nr:Gfo/Idh/MocA family oxidoreductase [Candidatus Hydrogenedentota bacterium]HPC17352.1 Gfo/Idh/MocA family oxidoreductase [Candidatus Hydrogenedentota bacterium]HRT20086.1 Gfo/Idh/MocA family oxidoreductase [Candidatus Hydrogenedentota bacterium]HRT64850.1 Gfo/Idh/MocA family oxidoreductase [Candidatus Hydrogenedentota bacterium]